MIVRDTVAIKSVGTYLKKQSEELQEVKTSLIKQIKEIEDEFKSKEANNIISKLESIINDLKYYTENLNYYGEFMINLANHDLEVTTKTKKNLLNIGEIK